MEEKSKSILGSRGRRFFFTKTEQHKIIQEYLTTCCSKQEIWNKYTGESVEHGKILRWMRQLGYSCWYANAGTGLKPPIQIIG